MFNFFAKRFVKDYENYKNPKVRLNLISLSSVIAIAINLVLVAIKLTAGIYANSTSIINDAVNNLADSVVALMAFVGSRLSNKPADKNHPHGHGRSESLITLLVSILIIYVGISLLFKSIRDFNNNSLAMISPFTLLILLFSILGKYLILRMNKNLYLKLDSDLNYGVMVDSRNDILATSAIFIGAIIGDYVPFNLDAALGILLAILIIVPGVKLFKSNVSYLLGSSVSQEIIKRIDEIILRDDLIVGYHNLEIHDYGRGHLDGSVDVDIAQNISILAAHKIITEIQKDVKAELGVILSVHMDPTYTLIIDDEMREKIDLLEKQAKNEYEDF